MQASTLSELVVSYKPFLVSTGNTVSQNLKTNCFNQVHHPNSPTQHIAFMCLNCFYKNYSSNTYHNSKSFPNWRQWALEQSHLSMCAFHAVFLACGNYIMMSFLYLAFFSSDAPFPGFLLTLRIDFLIHVNMNEISSDWHLVESSPERSCHAYLLWSHWLRYSVSTGV